MALNYLILLDIIPHQIFCVDSKSVLQAKQSTNSKVRVEMLFEIQHLIHMLRTRGSEISFGWLPSHCGLFFSMRGLILLQRKVLRKVNILR